MSKIEPEIRNKEQTDSGYRGRGGERRGRDKQRNTKGGLMGMENEGEIDCGSRGAVVGVSKGAKGGATVTEQQ